MNTYCFVDGGHLRETAKRTGKPLVDPRTLATRIAYSGLVQHWRNPGGSDPRRFVGYQSIKVSLDRVIYYDARPDDGGDPLIEEYWSAIEILPDTELGFGAVRGRRRRQKKVDSLMAVDMLEGAFTKLFQVAILVAADADFVPIVQAVRRRGVMVVVAASEQSLSDELRRAADRVWLIDVAGERAEFPALWRDEKVWYERPDGTVELGSA